LILLALWRPLCRQSRWSRNVLVVCVRKEDSEVLFLTPWEGPRRNCAGRMLMGRGKFRNIICLVLFSGISKNSVFLNELPFSPMATIYGCDGTSQDQAVGNRYWCSPLHSQPVWRPRLRSARLQERGKEYETPSRLSKAFKW
jgi:hypothetical protein